MESSFRHTDIPVAVIGMACRLPGADNLDQFWRLLSSGGSAVVELPSDRLDQELYYQPQRGVRGKSYSKLGAIISSREFDPRECPIPEQLQRSVDNAHLLMCQTAAAALRHAGLDPFRLAGRNAGVYIGHAQGSDLAGEFTLGTCIEEAAQFLREVPGFAGLPAADQEAIIGELIETVRSRMPQRQADSPDFAINMVAGVISRAFGLTGPYVGINSACASSLQAVMYGVRALQLGRIDMAVVGGASDCKSDSLVLFSHAQSMSETGSRPFDASADGLICSEGYVALVLKTLPQALADGDPVQAVIRGLGASCDGKGKSLWAPRKEGQVKAMARAYRHGLDMSSLQYIEAHATSTNLGDATELNALAEILADKFPAGKRIPITSVKANIGHALESAGVSSVIKTILCLKNRTFVPAINITSLNPKIDWDSVPFYIQRELAPWPEQPGGLPRRAAVNAFGIGGLNVHIVLEEFTDAQRATALAQLAADGAAQKKALPTVDEQAVAVIGMGCIFPGAANLAKFWEELITGRDPKSHATPDRWRTDLAYRPGSYQPYRAPTTLGGFITDFAYDWRRHKVPPKQVQEADPLQFMLLDAAEQALIDAGYDKKPFDRERMGVLVGTEFGSDFSIQLELGLKLPKIEQWLKGLLGRRGIGGAPASDIASGFSDVVLKHWPALVDESGSFSTSTLASRITKTMNLMGGAAAIDSGNAAAAAALAASVDALVSGDCDMMICAAGQRCMSLATFEGMAAAGALSTQAQPRGPFDAAADGVVPGEGVGVVVLKRLADARRDGDRIHAIIRGIGAAHSHSAEEAQRLAIERSIAIAGVDPAQVDVVELDGCGLPSADEEQLRAVLSVYGRPERKTPLLVGSATGQIGHTIGASAMASLIKASLEVEAGEVPASFAVSQPLPIVAQNSQQLRVPTAREALRPATPDGRRLGAVMSYGKGLAYNIILERGEKVAVGAAPSQPVAVSQTVSVAASPTPASIAPAPATSTPGAWQIVRVGAASPADLAAAVQNALRDCAATFAAASTSTFSPADRVRLAVVANSAEILRQKLDAAAKQLGNPAAWPVLEQQGIFSRELGPRRPRIALVFPGQGSHYAGMLKELVRDVPAAAATMHALDAAMRGRGYQTFAQMAWENSAQLGKDVWATQVVMLLADTIMHAALADRGIRADLVTGHSYGEYAALTAAGVWDYEGVVTAARARYEGIEATPTARGAMLATTAPAELVEQLAATLPRPAFAANYNAPDQTVVGGSPESLQALSSLLEARGHKSQILPVPCPFHTPLMAGSGDLLKRTLVNVALSPPQVPLLSSVTNRYVADPEDIRANLAAQLTTPVRWVDLVRRVAAERETVFVEVGPQTALTKLNRRILEGTPVAGIIACDNPKRPGVEQLVYVQALLECTGAIDVRQASASQATHFAAPSSHAGPSHPQPAPAKSRGTVWHVDATERRRDKMRDAAKKETAKQSAAPVQPPAHVGGNGHSTHTPAGYSPAGPSANGNHGTNGNGDIAKPAAPVREVVTTPASGAAKVAPAKPAVTPAAQAPAAPSAPATAAPAVAHAAPQATPKAAGPAPAELEKFLINFVVEQTGYPPEVVELDADLEADLGIDSIKKAQLFGELAEYFDVQPTEGMTLDDFPTLRHVLNFLAGAPMKGAATLAEPAPAAPTAAPTVQSAPLPASAPAPTVKPGGPAPAELEKFLINFVVEQTGYPPEVVELDADLEADLGIDSIKKAQLFGELAEYFDVQPTEGMTLDDFPTLRHVLNFLAGAPMKSAGAEPTAAVQAMLAVAPPATQPVAVPTPVTEAPVAPPAPVAAAPAPAVAVKAGGPAPEELEKFLINFVVEQTGYPPEVVELDADLEADLGIDSIKKAQLFGEMAEYFDVQPTEGMTLDDFPTLRHVLNFLAGAPMKSAGAESTAAVQAMLAVAPPAPQPVVPPTPAVPAAPVQVAAPVPAAAPASIASTLASAAPNATSAPAVAIKAGGPAADELEKFLINFVVEQTGYPPEVVELDADLEADLGIDSIKKAQLFGELAEYFDVQPTEGMTLDDFPTLRHVLNFLVGADLKKNLTPSQFDDSVAVEPAPVTAPHAPLPEAAPAIEPAAVAVAEPPTVATDAAIGLEVLALTGTPYEIGFAHGRQHKQVIRRILRRYADLAGPEFDELPSVARSATALRQHFTADELDELRGIADAAGVSLANIVAHNLAAFADFGAHGTQFAVSAATNPIGGLLHAAGQSWPLSAALRECLLPIVQVRRPLLGIPHLMLSFIGATAGLFGVNAAGLAVTASVSTAAASNARHGRSPAARASLVLSQAGNIDTAISLLRNRAGDGSWQIVITEPSSDRICEITSDGRQVTVRDRAGSVITAETDGGATASSAQSGTVELQRLLAGAGSAGITAEAIKHAFQHGDSDRNGAAHDAAHPVDSLTHRAEVIIDRPRGDLWISTAGAAGHSSHAFQRLSLAQLLPSAAAAGWQTATDPTITPGLEPGAEEHTHRFVVETFDAPHDASVPDMPVWQGAALIVGTNPAAVALRARLEAGGARVHTMDVSDDLDATVAELDRIWKIEPIPHLFIMTGRDRQRGDLLDAAAWDKRWYRVAIASYYLCQRWVQLAGQAKLLDRCTLVAATAMGGKLGFSDPMSGPECGALTGLLKAILIELKIMRGVKGLQSKAIDSPDNESPEQLAANICRELASKSIDFEVAYQGTNRQLPYAFPEYTAPQRPTTGIRPGAVWVVTGGARGITARCALELGSRFGLKLHLIGTSPLRAVDPAWRNLSEDQLKTLKANVMRDAAQAGQSLEDAWNRVRKDIEIDASMQAFAAASVEVTYHACDVADAVALAGVLAQIRQQSGPIEGILHGAGIERAAAFERKKRDGVAATLASKVDGAVNLLRLTWHDPLRHFVTFGSISGRLGGNGQTDYSLASDAICKLAAWCQSRRPGVHAVGFHWHPWADIGMAANPETVAMIKRSGGPQQMSKDEGVMHLVRELAAGPSATEVLITDWDYYSRFYGTGDVPEADRRVAEKSAAMKQAVISGNAPVPAAKQPAETPLAWEPAAAPHIAARWEPRMVAAPLPPTAAAASQLNGVAMIMGDNRAARALADRLAVAGATVHMLPVADTVEEASRAIESAYQAHQPRYLFIMSGRDEQADILDRSNWNIRRARGVVIPFMAAQHWFRLRMKAKDRSPITIVAVTSLGGDFGFSSHVATPDGGALAGLMKSIYIEDTRKPEREVFTKVIDAPADERPEALAEAVLRELSSQTPDVEVAWSRGERSIPRSVQVPVESLPRHGVPRGGTWVVTGGARGITAAVAMELGKRYGVKLHLIGRSPAPQADAAWRDCSAERLSEIKAEIVRRAVAEGRSPERDWERVKVDIEIDETLKKLAAAGLTVKYHACDLTDWERLKVVLDDIRRIDGPIEGIVHGAGFADSGRFGTRSPEKFERTIAGKLDGAAGLMSLTLADPVRYFVGFGSISGRFGGNGLSDYAAANDMLAKLLDWYRAKKPTCATSTIHWQSWDEVGMAMLGDSNVGTKGILKMEFIRPIEGIDHLCRELEAGLPTAEVLVTDGFFERTFYPFAVVADVPTSTGSATVERRPIVASTAPLESGSGLVAEMRFDPTQDPFLIDHKLRGNPLLPAVVALEAQAEAAALATGKHVAELKNVQMLDGLSFRTERAIVAHVQATVRTSSVVDCELSADFHNRSGKLMQAGRLYQRATAIVSDAAARLDIAQPAAPSAWLEFTFPENMPIYHGPTLQGLRATSFGNEPHGWARLVALPLSNFGGARTGRDWIVPATLLDAAFYVCGTHAFVYGDGAVSLPQSIEAVRLGRMPRDNEACLVEFRCREITPQFAIYDFTVFGDDGTAIVSVLGHRIVMLRTRQA